MFLKIEMSYCQKSASYPVKIVSVYSIYFLITSFRHLYINSNKLYFYYHSLQNNLHLVYIINSLICECLHVSILFMV